MTEIKYWTQLATEQFGPAELIEQAEAAERARFDGLDVSDHYQPWWEPGESAHAWVILGAIGHGTRTIPIGTGVTAPVFRHNPAVVAQAFTTLEVMAPGARSSGSAPARASTRARAGWTGRRSASRSTGWRRRWRSSTACSTASDSTTTATTSGPRPRIYTAV